MRIKRISYVKNYFSMNKEEQITVKISTAMSFDEWEKFSKKITKTTFTEMFENV